MIQKQYTVYILASINKTLYIGVTNNIERRLYEHKTAYHADSFTAQYAITKLVYVEYYTDISAALAREKQLKRWNRNKKIALIEKDNLYWKDLSQE